METFWRLFFGGGTVTLLERGHVALFYKVTLWSYMDLEGDYEKRKLYKWDHMGKWGGCVFVFTWPQENVL